MSSVEESSTKKIILKSSDGETFVIAKAVAMKSQTVKNLIEDVGEDTGIPISEVTGRILAKVIEYCKKHVEAESSDGKPSEDELKKWDAEFVKVDKPTLFDLISAANYLDIKSLLDLTCMTVADIIKAMTPEEIRNFLNIKDDFTAEEKKELRRENQWAFE